MRIKVKIKKNKLEGSYNLFLSKSEIKKKNNLNRRKKKLKE
jgi:hypothetical protein